MTWFLSMNFSLLKENESLISAIIEKISTRQLTKTLNFSRQSESIKKSFEKKVQCSKQLTSQRCKNNLRTRKRRTIRLIKEILKEKIENVCAWKCIYLKNALTFANQLDLLTEKKTKRFEMKCVNDWRRLKRTKRSKMFSIRISWMK